MAAIKRRARLYLLHALGALARRLKGQGSTKIQRILVIRPDHLGDVLLLTPALRLLRRQRPDAEITLLIGSWSRLAVAHNPHVDTILLCPFPGFTRADKPHPWQPYLLLLKFALLLRAGRYDAALITRDDHWWGAALAALAGIPHRLGYALPETTPFLTRSLPHSFDQHVTRQSIALIEALTGQAADQQPVLTPPMSQQDEAWADAWLATHGVVTHRPLVAIHPGTGGAAKLWLAERWAAVADALHERGFQVILTGGPVEQELAATITQHMIHPPLMLVNAATLSQLAALYSRCALVLGVDSGPLHLAVAAGAPTLALFGPGDHQRFGPWGDPHRQVVLRSDLWCSPCGVLHECPRGTAPSECMTLIPTTQVLAAVDHLLSP